MDKARVKQVAACFHLKPVLALRAGRRKLFVPIATHEFGHSLGLGHSRERRAIMYAYYSGSSPIVQLHQDDINGIQRLYGRRGAQCFFAHKLKSILSLGWLTCDPVHVKSGAHA